VILDKITTNHAYLAATNYWTPLQTDENEEDKETEEANKINNNQIPKSNKWKRRLAKRIEKQMVIDSGATTHFCNEEMDLPKEGESNKAVYLPNGDHSNDKENIPPFSTTQEESKRSTCTPTATTIIDECEQIVRRRIHNNFPPGK